VECASWDDEDHETAEGWTATGNTRLIGPGWKRETANQRSQDDTTPVYVFPGNWQLVTGISRAGN
jgi:hypothetical protein